MNFSGPRHNHGEPGPVLVQRDQHGHRPQQPFERLPLGGRPRVVARGPPQFQEHASSLDGTDQEHAAHFR